MLPRPARAALLDMLWRSRHCVREVSSLQLDKADEAAAGPLRDAEGRSPLAVLAGLRRVRSLALTVHHDYPYARQLAAGLPGLQHLEVGVSFAARCERG